MHLPTYIYSFLFGKFVGKDEYGNSYYRSSKLFNKKEKRWVLYKGVVEASKIPALWHRWIHYTSDHLPSEIQIEKQDWQKGHKANFTGTSMAYHPHKNSAPKAKSYYESWQPED